MRVRAMFIALGFCLPSLVAVAANQVTFTSDTQYINYYLDGMVQDHQAAFVSTCAVLYKAAKYQAAIVFFPMKNKGMFIFTDKNHVVLNSGDVEWDPDGQWDMGNLEGGVYTIMVMSDLFYKLTRLPFSWASPKDVKRMLAAQPHNSCTLLKG